MDPADFQAQSAGRVVKTTDGHWAFVPAPLPPALDYTPGLVMALSSADAALSELSGLGRNLPNPHLLIAPYMRLEAVLSSRIEGTRTELADLLLDEVQAEAPSRDAAEVREIREVHNYVRALEYGITRLRELPLSLRLVRELHERLMTNVRGEHAAPGQFRRTQNWIGPPGSAMATATYVPPPPDELSGTLDAWERFLHVREAMPDLIQCGLIHQQFEAIHPFLDGNGRVGRLLIPLFLMERGRLSQPLLYWSAFCERHRTEYYDHLQRVRTPADWTGWLQFFLVGIREASTDAVRQAGELMDLRERWRGMLRRKPRALQLIDQLFVNPYVTVGRAAHSLGVSNPTARQVVVELTRQGIIEETTGRAWRRLYLARSILQAIQPPRSR